MMVEGRENVAVVAMMAENRILKRRSTSLESMSDYERAHHAQLVRIALERGAEGDLRSKYRQRDSLVVNVNDARDSRRESAT